MIRGLCIGLVSAMMAGTCMASYTVTVKTAGGVQEWSVGSADGTDRPIQVTANSACVYITTTSTGGNTPVIGNLTWDTSGGTPASIKLVFGSTYQSSDVLPTKISGSWNGSLTGATFPVELYGGITGDYGWNCADNGNPLCDNNGISLTVDKLVRFDVGGAVRGNFVIGAPGGTAPAVRIPVYCPRGASLRGRQVGSAV